MQCQNCHKNPAQLHFTNVQDNRMTEVHLCRACAEERGLVGLPVTPKFSIADLLASMVDKSSTTEEERVGPVQCPTCGLHFSAFDETLRLGCADCYVAFKSRLKPLLRSHDVRAQECEVCNSWVLLGYIHQDVLLTRVRRVEHQVHFHS